MTVRNIHSKRHALRKLRGETAYVDATPIRLHLATLFGAGWSLRSIAGTAGVSATTLSRIRRDQRVTASPETIRKVLAVRPDAIAERTNRPGAEPFVPRIGTTRRIRALMAIGYSHADLAALGIDSRNLVNQQGRWVTRTTHDGIAALYKDLSRRAGPTPRAAREAAKRGYPGPADWDDIDLDLEPDAGESSGDIDDVAIDRAMEGDRSVRLSKTERHELARRWAASGRSLNEMERITGINSHRYLEAAS